MLLSNMGKNVIHCGDVGTGEVSCEERVPKLPVGYICVNILQFFLQGKAIYAVQLKTTSCVVLSKMYQSHSVALTQLSIHPLPQPPIYQIHPYYFYSSISQPHPLISNSPTQISTPHTQISTPLRQPSAHPLHHLPIYQSSHLPILCPIHQQWHRSTLHICTSFTSEDTKLVTSIAHIIVC